MAVSEMLGPVGSVSAGAVMPHAVRLISIRVIKIRAIFFLTKDSSCYVIYIKYHSTPSVATLFDL
jgi:hypothetical protein